MSAPSGTGKTTLVERLVQRIPNLRMSRSYTSRPARPGEQDGVDYNFISRERFEDDGRGQARSSSGPTSSATTTGRAAADTEALPRQRPGRGARHRRPGRAAGAQPRDRDDRHLRAAAVGRDPRAAAARPQQGLARSRFGDGSRWRAARWASSPQYDYVVVNDELDAAVERLRAIVLAERARVQVMRTTAETIIGTFQTETS